MMNAAYIVTVLVVACILCELPTCDAGCHGPPGTSNRRNRTRCTDHSNCTADNTACMKGKCQPCECRLKTQCFLNKANKPKCNCTDDTMHTGDHCECPLASPCDSGWILCDGTCFFFGADTAKWRDSLGSCLHLGGQLAKVDSAAKHKCIVEELNAIDVGDRYWIGGRYSNNGQYVWLDSSPVLSPDYWAPSMPGNIQGCMTYMLDPPLPWSWFALDNMFCAGPDGALGHYICEKAA